MPFQISALPAEPFSHLFGLSDRELAAKGDPSNDRRPASGLSCACRWRTSTSASVSLLMKLRASAGGLALSFQPRDFVREGAVQGPARTRRGAGALSGTPARLPCLDGGRHDDRRRGWPTGRTSRPPSKTCSRTRRCAISTSTTPGTAATTPGSTASESPFGKRKTPSRRRREGQGMAVNSDGFERPDQVSTSPAGQQRYSCD